MNEKGKRLWRKNSIGTCKRNKKTMHAFFQRCIVRKWITEDPTVIINFEKEKRKKEKKEVKYLTSDQMTDVLWACDKFDRMPDYNKLVKLFREEGVSGTKDISHRPALVALIEALHSNGVKLVRGIPRALGSGSDGSGVYPSRPETPRLRSRLGR